MVAAPVLNTPQGALKVFEIYHRQMLAHGFDLADAVVLNIGAGNLVGLDALFLLFGAARVISADLSQGRYDYPDASHQKGVYEVLGELSRAYDLAGPGSWDEVLITRNGRLFYDTKRLIRLVPADAAFLPLRDQCIDFCFSNAVLEHVAQPRQTVNEIARVLKSGGHTMHRVDLRDHADFNRPLDFLKTEQPDGVCNKWRACHFQEAFGLTGLELAEFSVFDICRVSPAQRSNLAPRFAALSENELGKLRFMVYAKKPLLTTQLV